MKAKSIKATKTTKNSKDFYSFKNYSPNKNAKPVVYNGTTYLSRAQCMALEGITRKELDAYLHGQTKTVVEPETPEQIAIEENLDKQSEELVPDIDETSLDSLLNN